MRAARLIEFTAQLLAEHPSIESVEPFDDPGTQLKPCGLKVITKDGAIHYLKMTRTSGDSGENFSEPEQILYALATKKEAS